MDMNYCCECGVYIEGDDIYSTVGGDYCAWCHRAYFGYDEYYESKEEEDDDD